MKLKVLNKNILAAPCPLFDEGKDLLVTTCNVDKFKKDISTLNNSDLIETINDIRVELKEKGLITDEEFQKAKEKILEGKL